MTWEYEKDYLRWGWDDREVLDLRGSQGWELVSVQLCGSDGSYYAWFKREKSLTLTE